MNSRAVQLLEKYNYVKSASCISMHFEDSGLFGLQLAGDTNRVRLRLAPTIRIDW